MESTAQKTANKIREHVISINDLLQEANEAGMKVTFENKWNPMVNAANGLPPNPPLSVSIKQEITL